MDPKNRPNHSIYIETLRQMTPEQRLLKTFELSKLSRDLFIAGLHSSFPKLSESDFHKLLLERLAKCHNRNY